MLRMTDFLALLEHQPDVIRFSDTMAVIDENYNFEPTAFRNGDVKNAPGENNGSCKIFAFGLKHNLTEDQTLACFGDYYRKDVLENLQGKDHQNIRQFSRKGWRGIYMEGSPLISK